MDSNNSSESAYCYVYNYTSTNLIAYVQVMSNYNAPITYSFNVEYTTAYRIYA